MPFKPYDPPLWSRLYPQLLDKEYVMRIYAKCKNQKNMAKEIGCAEKTIRAALKYHELKKPFAFIMHKD